MSNGKKRTLVPNSLENTVISQVWSRSPLPSKPKDDTARTFGNVQRYVSGCDIFIHDAMFIVPSCHVPCLVQSPGCLCEPPARVNVPSTPLSPSSGGTARLPPSGLVRRAESHNGNPPRAPNPNVRLQTIWALLGRYWSYIATPCIVGLAAYLDGCATCPVCVCC
jgi:hypothetical protein